MQIAAIIPSRYESSRFLGKPLAKIAGKPMIRWVYERAKKVSYVSDVFVATDHEKIFDAVINFGGKAVMTSKENRSGTDRAGEAAKILNFKQNDIIVNIQGDQPLIDPRCIAQVIDPFLKETNLEIATLACKIVNEKERTDPKDVKVVIDQFDNALYFSRAPIPWGRDRAAVFDMYKHLGIYAYTCSFLEKFRNLPSGPLEKIEKLEQLRAIEYGCNIKVVLTEYDSPEVDIPEDILRIEKIISKEIKNI